jgi:type I restriction enzyme, S subunit
MDAWPLVPLAEVAPITRRPVETEPDRVYPIIAARGFGRGIFRQPTLIGAELTWQRLFQARTGDLLISNIKAWEGAVGVVSQEDDGCFCSHRYITCVCDRNRVIPEFLFRYLTTPVGLRKLGEISPGSADRNRTLSQRKLAALMVPLPTIKEQRLLVAKFDHVAALVRAARHLLDEVDLEIAALLAQTERKIWPDDAVASGEPLGEVTIYLSRGRQSKQGDSNHFLIKSQHVQMGFCRPTDLTLAPWVAEKVGEEARVEDGDVLIACSAAGCLGRVALFKADGRIASTDTHVAIARADRTRVLPEYLFAYLRSAVGQQQLRSREQGSLGRERIGFRLAELNQRDLRRVPVPVPSIEKQHQILTETGAIRTKLCEVREHRDATRGDLDLLLGRLLRDVFAGNVGAKHHLEDRPAA